MNRKTLCRLAVWIAAAGTCVAGCRREAPPRMVKITVSYPGASPTEVDEKVVGPVKTALDALPDAGQVTTIGSSGRTEIYVKPISGGDPWQLLDGILEAVERLGATLPAEVSLAVQPMPTETVPRAPVGETRAVRVELDPAKAAALGITAQAVAEAVARAKREGRPLDEVTLDTPDGHAVPLSEVAEITVAGEPASPERTGPPRPETSGEPGRP